MDVPLGLAVAILALSLLLMFVVALAEVSLATISRAHVRKLGEQGVSSALLVEALLVDVERFLGGILVLRTIAIGVATATTVWVIMNRGGEWLGIVQALVILFAVLLLFQVLARVMAVQRPVSISLKVVRPIRWLTNLAAPISWVLVKIVQRFGVKDEDKARNIFLTEDGLRLLLNFGEEERYIEAEEREMIDSIFRFSETSVEEVMVPRVDVIALDHTASLQEALNTIVEAGHSRIPVYDDSIDHIVGVLYAKDLLICYRDRRMDVSVPVVMREPYFVPESAMVDDLLGDLQRKKTHLAIVVDEYGGTAGVVTIEDLLEEIVGEIQDEYDSESPLLLQTDEGEYMVNGRIDIDDLNRDLGVTLTDEDESYTLAGVIYSQLQRVPKVGDSLILNNVYMEVLEVTDNRIDQVRLVVEHPANDEGESNGFMEAA
ncbi:MAG: HlyC/CorC family transporter [Chloroflexi bacterium]|nr:HlyC/CorC family transporter [Chloroflexota bacterium]